ncbi:hypothetical protein HN51_046875 [Arachis hypogaea]
MLLSQKKRKTAQFEMAKEVCLCLVSYERLFVIKLSNLKKEEVDVKDWTCLSSPNFDLDLELPEHDLCPFVFDSKIYLATSELPLIIKHEEPVSMEDLKPWSGWPVYEFKFEEGRFGRAESLDDAPLPLHQSTIANTPGSGDVYFYMNLKTWVKDSSGFYVLSPGSRVWRPLMAAQAICDTHLSNCLFVLDNNLFFSSFKGTDSCLSRFDPIKESWTVEPSSANNLSNFIIGRVIEDPLRLTFPPHISVSLPGLGSRNYTVCLTHEFVELPPDMTPLDKVLAILVNQQSGHVALYQYLDLCFQGIQPELVECGRLIFVDLGNGKLCAILTGDSYLSDSVTLCISVFTLSADFTALQLDSGAPPMERDFLQVTVHSKSVYTMNRTRLANHICHAFVWPPTKGGRFNDRTTRPF